MSSSGSRRTCWASLLDRTAPAARRRVRSWPENHAAVVLGVLSTCRTGQTHHRLRAVTQPGALSGAFALAFWHPRLSFDRGPMTSAVQPSIVPGVLQARSARLSRTIKRGCSMTPSSLFSPHISPVFAPLSLFSARRCAFLFAPLFFPLLLFPSHPSLFAPFSSPFSYLMRSACTLPCLLRIAPQRTQGGWSTLTVVNRPLKISRLRPCADACFCLQPLAQVSPTCSGSGTRMCRHQRFMDGSVSPSCCPGHAEISYDEKVRRHEACWRLLFVAIRIRNRARHL